MLVYPFFNVAWHCRCVQVTPVLKLKKMLFAILFFERMICFSYFRIIIYYLRIIIYYFYSLFVVRKKICLPCDKMQLRSKPWRFYWSIHSRISSIQSHYPTYAFAMEIQQFCREILAKPVRKKFTKYFNK